MKIWVKANTNVVMKLKDDLTAKFQLQESENISISKKRIWFWNMVFILKSINATKSY